MTSRGCQTKAGRAWRLFCCYAARLSDQIRAEAKPAVLVKDESDSVRIYCREGFSACDEDGEDALGLSSPALTALCEVVTVGGLTVVFGNEIDLCLASHTFFHSADRSPLAVTLHVIHRAPGLGSPSSGPSMPLARHAQ